MLEVTAAEGVTTLTLARADRGNALAPELVAALHQRLAAAEADPTMHTVIFRGAGPHLCTGFDLSDLATLTDGDLLLRLVHIEQFLTAVWESPLRTVALGQGRTWGAGADLFAACEHRFALPGVTFRFPGAQFGLVLGTRRLAERVGADAARHGLIAAQEWDAARALALGLATARAESAEDALAQLPEPRVSRPTAAALRAASRHSAADADLAALVRSAAVPGLRQRIEAYRASLRSASAR